MKTNKIWIVSTLVGLVAIIVGFGLGWIVKPSTNPKFTIIEGTTTTVNEEGDAIGLEIDPETEGVGYQITGAWWREEDGPWHTHGPTCLEPLSSGQDVRLGVVELEGIESPRGDVVIWLICLEEPGS